MQVHSASQNGTKCFLPDISVGCYYWWLTARVNTTDVSLSNGLSHTKTCAVSNADQATEGWGDAAHAEIRPGRMDESVTQCVLGDCEEASTLVRDLSGCIILQLNWVSLSCKVQTALKETDFPIVITEAHELILRMFQGKSKHGVFQGLKSSLLHITYDFNFCFTGTSFLQNKASFLRCFLENFSILWISLQLASSHFAHKKIVNVHWRKYGKWSRKKTKKHP